MATHSIMVAWKIPWTEEPLGRLQSRGLQRVRRDRVTEYTRDLTFKIYPYCYSVLLSDAFG